jgi:hypothetical protein
VPPENSVQAIAKVLSSKRIEGSTSLRLCLSLMNENSPMCATRETVWARLTFRIDPAEQEICDLNLEDYH